MSEPNIERAKALIVEADGGAPWNRFDILALMLTFAKEHAAAAVAQAKRDGAIEELRRLVVDYEKYAASENFDASEKNVYWEERGCHLKRIDDLKDAPRGN